MKILVVSDSHGHTEEILSLVKQYPKMDVYLHAGDSQEMEVSLFPYQTVRGNCDYDSNMMKRLLIDTPYGKLLMTHAPFVSEEELKEQNIKIYVYGHLHKRVYKKEDEIYYISPGSTCYERDSNNEGYVILTITKKTVRARFFDL